MATPTAEILDFFKSMEASRIKMAAEASVAQAAARKDDLRNYDLLSKRLSKKNDQAKHNLKQTAILVGTADAMSLLAEGLLIYV